eukprot:scaffold1167_cov154-Isochrysis_galbana.AAC.8
MPYLDDIGIFSTGTGTGATLEERKESSFQQMLHRLDLVLERLIWAGLTCKMTKCTFFSVRAEYLGHIVSREGLSIPQSGMVQPVVNEMFATVHAAGSSLLGLFTSCTTFDSTRHKQAPRAKAGNGVWCMGCEQAYHAGCFAVYPTAAPRRPRKNQEKARSPGLPQPRLTRSARARSARAALALWKMAVTTATTARSDDET